MPNLFGKKEKITFNLAVGGNFFSNFNPSLIHTGSMYVDWIKVFTSIKGIDYNFELLIKSYPGIPEWKYLLACFYYNEKSGTDFLFHFLKIEILEIKTEIC